MSSVNRVALLGRLGNDPELKYTPSGQAVCSFSLATGDSYTDKQGNKQESTEWHNIVVWGAQAEACAKYLAKGRQAYIEGKIKTDVWEKDGKKNYSTKIHANSVVFIGDSRSNDNRSNQQRASQQANQGEEIPF